MRTPDEVFHAIKMLETQLLYNGDKQGRDALHYMRAALFWVTEEDNHSSRAFSQMINETEDAQRKLD